MRTRTLTIIGVVLVLIGLGAAVLPATWIEDVAGVEPDGGSGALEFLIALGILAVGTVCLAVAYVRTAAQRRHGPQPRTSGH